MRLVLIALALVLFLLAGVGIGHPLLAGLGVGHPRAQLGWLAVAAYVLTLLLPSLT